MLPRSIALKLLAKRQCRQVRVGNLRAHPQAARGFTLIELVMVIVILGVLAATALPRFVALQRDARVAKVEDMAGRLFTFANQVRLKCAVTPSCDINASMRAFPVGGQNIILNYGWPDAGDALASYQIDGRVTTVGWTASLTNAATTKFALDSAPDPATCAASYHDAFSDPARTASVSTVTTGC